MDAVVKKTGKNVNVERVPIYVDEMTSYFVYEDKETKEHYKYSELKFELK